VNSVFVGKTVSEVSGMMGLVLKSPEDLLATRSQNPNPYESLDAVPDSFDSRTQWPGCVHPILNQAQCGSCWAFSSTEALSDRYVKGNSNNKKIFETQFSFFFHPVCRFCIASKNAVNVVLSPQYVVSCDGTDGGCQGGELANVWRFLVNTGTTTFSCVPYTAQNGTVEACPSTCVDGSPIKMYKAKNSYAVGGMFSFGRVTKIQNEIMKNGPVQTGFEVYQDFINYKSGVYQHTSGNLLGGHAVKIIGWGTENNVPYWLVANSWGPDWGLQVREHSNTKQNKISNIQIRPPSNLNSTLDIFSFFFLSSIGFLQDQEG
jgi:cathepsin B